MLSEILYDESINDLEGILKMEKWEKRDKKRNTKKKFKDFKNNIKSISVLADTQLNLFLKRGIEKIRVLTIHN